MSMRGRTSYHAMAIRPSALSLRVGCGSLHVPLSEGAAAPFLGEAQHPQVVVDVLQRLPGVVGVVSRGPDSDRDVVLHQERPVRTNVGPRLVAVLQPGRDDLDAAACHVVAHVPEMAAVLGVFGEQRAYLLW